MNDMLQNMSTDNKDVVVCANCGKEGDNLKACAACKLVKYCNRECQIAHRPQHKKECKKRAAELHDEQLFRQPPPAEDCPICFQRLPTLDNGSRYYACCGKEICSGCNYAPVYDNQGNEVDNQKCPFCRIPWLDSDEELVERYEKRVKAGDAEATCRIGCYYRDGECGLPQDYDKAFELLHRAAELGNADANGSIGYAYQCGEGMEVDKEKAIYYYEQAAMGGCVIARYNLGIEENDAGNIDRAIKHYMIAVRCGDSQSLEKVKEFYANGQATKEDYTKALRSYQTYLAEIKTSQRDKAATAHDDCRYY